MKSLSDIGGRCGGILRPTDDLRTLFQAGFILGKVGVEVPSADAGIRRRLANGEGWRTTEAYEGWAGRGADSGVEGEVYLF